MTLKLYFHPLASFCWKPLIAPYENDTPFEPVIVDLADPASSAAFRCARPRPISGSFLRERLQGALPGLIDRLASAGGVAG